MVTEQGEDAVSKQGKQSIKAGPLAGGESVWSLSKAALSKAPLSKAIRALL